MKFSKVSFYAEKGFVVLFPLFLFFGVIFCGFTRVNNLFHLSSFCLLGTLAGNPVLCRQLFSDHRFNVGLLLIILMLSYFCFSTIWSTRPMSLILEFIHAIYLLLFVIMYRLMAIIGLRSIALGAVAAGIIVLLILTFLNIDTQTILINRLDNGFFGAPSNAIDLAGYFVLGILICLIIMRDTGIFYLYLPVTILLLAILLTQSRGPLFSLLCSSIIFLNLRFSFYKRHLIALALIGLIVTIIFSISHFGDIFLQRILNSYQQSFIRFNIWQHTLDLVMQKPFFGWGLDKQLSFINLLGDNITTTHSLYLAALLKGGVTGALFLLLVINYGFIMAKHQCNANQGLEGMIFLFSVIFYLTQGMFILSNPNVSWYMFWLPLAIVLTLPISNS